MVSHKELKKRERGKEREREVIVYCNFVAFKNLPFNEIHDCVIDHLIERGLFLTLTKF